MNYKTHTIQVFEHELLKVDSKNGFSQVHWEKLGWYNEEHGGKYFSLAPKGVKFKNYVGVIQVDDLTIEILPKLGGWLLATQIKLAGTVAGYAAGMQLDECICQRKSGIAI